MSSLEKSLFLSAVEELYHRGPDDKGIEIKDSYALGFKRLSLQDLSEASHQPMFFGSGRYVLLFNGEIYNFKGLKDKISVTQWRSSGDTEVLGEWLLNRGWSETLDQLRGMFSFLWWDSHAKILKAARDPFGIKPLYYSHSTKQGLVIGSEWRSVFKTVGRPFDLDANALHDYLGKGSVSYDRTMSLHIRSLPPGHFLEWSQVTGEIKITRYDRVEDVWNNYESQLTGIEAIQQTQQVIAESVKAHLVSDVPVGAFLSGGLDSSLVVALMRQAGQSHIKAFSIGYEGEVGVPDETDAAEKTAKYYECEFTKLSINSDQLEKELDLYLACLDQPTGDGLNTYLVSKLAATQVKTTLSGLGADEWFAGYNYHRLLYAAKLPACSWIQKLPQSGNLVDLVSRKLPLKFSEHKIWKILRYASGANGKSVEQMQRTARTILDGGEINRLLVPTWQSGAPVSHDFFPSKAEHHDWLQTLLLQETFNYLPDTLLRDNDFTSMSQSLELRVPFVDKEVFKLAGRIASSEKLNFFQGKLILRKAFKDVLPPWIVEDKAKKTFTLPLMKWMQEPRWKERILDTFHSSQFRDRGIFDFCEVEKLLRDLYSNKILDKRAWKLTQKVWLLFIFESWLRRHTV